MLRFWRFVIEEPNSGCWIWLGTRSGGYGMFALPGTMVLAHKWLYEHLKGPTPTGRELDHTCRNKTCVNPMHLEAVTHLINCQRGPNPQKATCSRGHALVQYGPRRRCMICNRPKAAAHGAA